MKERSKSWIITPEGEEAIKLGAESRINGKKKWRVAKWRKLCNVLNICI